MSDPAPTPRGEAPAGPRAPIVYDRVVSLSPLVRRLTQRNPGPFTGPGTNTHLVGRSALFVLDPGEDRGDGHLEGLLAAIAGARVSAVIPSHGHDDHWPLARRLADRCGAPVAFYGTHPGFRTDRPLIDGEILDADGVRLRAIHTPGHTPDHLCFHLPEERALFPGDHVMAWSTSVIAPPEGNLRQYLDALERLLALPNLAVLYPAHGEAIPTPYPRMQELLAHREERTRQLLDALQSGPNRIGPLVARVYAEVDPSLHPAAAHSLLAHLLALEEQGRIRRVGNPAETWEAIVWGLDAP